VKYHLFGRILAPCRANNYTYQTLRTPSLKRAADVCMVGLVDLRARHSANIRAKSLIVSEKNYFNHCKPMQ
jgi:hypothetical protein